MAQNATVDKLEMEQLNLDGATEAPKATQAKQADDANPQDPVGAQQVYSKVDLLFRLRELHPNEEFEIPFKLSHKFKSPPPPPFLATRAKTPSKEQTSK